MAHARKAAASDIPAGNSVDRWVRAGVRPYLRLARIDRPIGIWLLMFPCWWSTALATPGWPDPWLLLLFAVGAAIMRGAGCTLNDLADRDFDARVPRTAARPIPSGAVSVRQAIAFVIALCLAGLVVLLQFNAFAVALGASSPGSRRALPVCQAGDLLAAGGPRPDLSWGALLGWAAVRGDLSLPAIILYAAGLLWTLGYDTIYAHQDKEDDILIGVKSTALRLRRRHQALAVDVLCRLHRSAGVSRGTRRSVVAVLCRARRRRRAILLAGDAPRCGRPEGLPRQIQVQSNVGADGLRRDRSRSGTRLS